MNSSAKRAGWANAARHNVLGWVALIALAILPFPAAAFTPVDTLELRDHPQRFWARGVVFQDTLQSIPGDRTTKLGDLRVIPFSTEILGECYVIPEAAEAIRQLGPGVKAAFSGTVQQVRRRFYYVIQDVAPLAVDLEQLAENLQHVDTNVSDNFYSQVFRQLETIIQEVQTEIFAHASANNLELQDYFQGGGTNLQHVSQSIRNVLREMENRNRTPNQEFFVALIASIMADQYDMTPEVKPTYEPEFIDQLDVPEEHILHVDPEPLDQVDQDQVDTFVAAAFEEEAASEETEAVPELEVWDAGVIEEDLWIPDDVDESPGQDEAWTEEVTEDVAKDVTDEVETTEVETAEEASPDVAEEAPKLDEAWTEEVMDDDSAVDMEAVEETESTDTETSEEPQELDDSAEAFADDVAPIETDLEPVTEETAVDAIDATESEWTDDLIEQVPVVEDIRVPDDAARLDDLLFPVNDVWVVQAAEGSETAGILDPPESLDDFAEDEPLEFEVEDEPEIIPEPIENISDDVEEPAAPAPPRARPLRIIDFDRPLPVP